MDSVTTDGRYGRQLLQLVRRLPIGMDPLFDRYRAAADIDHGDWDDLRRCLAANPIEASELEGLRDIWLASVGQSASPKAKNKHQEALFGVYELELQRNWRVFKQWARRMPSLQFSEVVWEREDIPATRHFLYRRLQDLVLLAYTEAHGGKLPVAVALAREAQRTGEEHEALRIVAADIEIGARVAMGERERRGLRLLRQIAGNTGFSPVGTWETLQYLMPFLTLLEDGSFEWSVVVTERIAARLGSPRAQFQTESWRVASELLAGKQPGQTELPGLLLQARSAVPGLRALPQLLDGYANPRHSAFAEALELGRRAGNVWIQVSALAWMAALDATPWTLRSLYRLLEVTGWRRPILVPTQIVADAALGLAAGGFRGASVVELALVAGRPNVTVDVASRHIEDARAPAASRLAAAHTLAKLGTARARELLQRLARSHDGLAGLARQMLSRPAQGIRLSEREVEVLSLAAKGLTNRDIGSQLGLSEHTIARHISNALNKLGASNRAEGVSRMHELGRDTIN